MRQLVQTLLVFYPVMTNAQNEHDEGTLFTLFCRINAL